MGKVLNRKGHYPSPCPSPKLALASLQLKVSAFASECGWGEGTLEFPLRIIRAVPSPIGRRAG